MILPHEEEESSDQRGVFLQKTHGSNLAFPARPELKKTSRSSKKMVSDHGDE